MDAVNRLIQAGIRPDCATQTVLRYEVQGDYAGLERYVAEMVNRAAKRRDGLACSD